MRRILLVAAIGAGIVPLSAGPAFACSCVQASPAELAGYADVIFTGITLEVIEPEPTEEGVVGGGENVVRFDVETVYKGGIGDPGTVRTGALGDSCGFRFAEGGRYSVFAERARDGLSTGICSGTTRGKIEPVLYGLGGQLSDGLARTGPLIPDWLRWTLGGAAVAAGGAGLWVFLRRHRAGPG